MDKLRKCIECNNWYHKDTLIEVEIAPEKEGHICKDCMKYIDTRKRLQDNAFKDA